MWSSALEEYEKILVEADLKGGVDVTQRDVREAIEQLDGEALHKITIHLIDGDTKQAKETLSSNSGLTEQQIDELLDSISKEVQEMLGTAENDSGLSTDIQNLVKEELARFVADIDAPGGPRVSSQDVRQALEYIDMQTLQSVATQLILRDVEGAKDVLVANTSLSDAQINDIVSSVNREVENTVANYEKELASATEAVATYSQAVLWAVFCASAIGLVLSIFGGLVGAATSKKLDVLRRQQVVV